MTQQEKVIAMLEQAGPEGVTSNQFYAACLPRFSARIHELRGKGFDIVKEPVENGHFRYILVGNGRAGADHPGPTPPGPGTNFIGSTPLPPVESSGAAPATPPAGIPLAAVPEPLFEVDEDGPGGPVNPYQWEAA